MLQDVAIGLVKDKQVDVLHGFAGSSEEFGDHLGNDPQSEGEDLRAVHAKVCGEQVGAICPPGAWGLRYLLGLNRPPHSSVGGNQVLCPLAIRAKHDWTDGR